MSADSWSETLAYIDRAYDWVFGDMVLGWEVRHGFF